MVHSFHLLIERWKLKPRMLKGLVYLKTWSISHSFKYVLRE